ncbi:hypothetical protein SEA_REYNAULD_24 [Rhodococcus phage Reynauld]|uniref:Uncharacterized protein n=1 Tax=Rhodococcus phage Reynauld TaxID=3062845 RepID=A0ACD4UJ44_9CAUD|nr:hypothetical protein SEA_REYNAULD_24 [Rhodococcus phage Reynauld]
MASRNSAFSSVVIEDKTARKAIEDVISRTGPESLAAYMTAIAAPYFTRKAKERFDTSEGWAPLADVTHDIRESMGFSRGDEPGQINVRTGMLRDWVTNPKIVIQYDAVGTVMKWPGDEPSSKEMKHRLEQAAGNRKGPARFVIQHDISDVAHLVSTLTAYVMGDQK